MSFNYYTFNTVNLEKQVKMSTVLLSKTSGSKKIHADVATSDTDSDEELFTAFQEHEFTLKTNENYANNQCKNAVQHAFANNVVTAVFDESNNIAGDQTASCISGLITIQSQFINVRP